MWQVSGLSGFGGNVERASGVPPPLPAPSRLLLHDARHGGITLPLGVAAANLTLDLRGVVGGGTPGHSFESESALCECDELCDLLCTDGADTGATSGRGAAGSAPPPPPPPPHTGVEIGGAPTAAS